MRIIIDGANRTRVELNNGTTLYISYQTCVAAHLPGVGDVRTSKKWSTTTSKMLNEWGMNKADQRPQQFFDDLMAAV